MTRSTSDSRLKRPKVNSSEPWASSWSSPHEMSVCDGSRVFEEQAEPVDTAMPSSLMDKSSDSPSMPSKRKWALLGRRSTGWPLRWESGMVESTSLMSRSRMAASLGRLRG